MTLKLYSSVVAVVPHPHTNQPVPVKNFVVASDLQEARSFFQNYDVTLCEGKVLEEVININGRSMTLQTLLDETKKAYGNDS